MGTMTSGGTDVIVMPASVSGSTTGVTLVVFVGDGVSPEVGVEPGGVTTVVGVPACGIDVAVEPGEPDETGNDGDDVLQALTCAQQHQRDHRPRPIDECPRRHRWLTTRATLWAPDAKLWARPDGQGSIRRT